MISDAELASSLLRFGRNKLGFTFYQWQANAIEPFDDISLRMVLVSLLTPNGSGKSSVVIPTIVLGVLALYPRAKIVLTTADGKQLDGQVMPAIEAHRGKFPTWNFIEREVLTPGPSGSYKDGGRFVCFTTDDAGRAEGWHKFPDATDATGPLVIIADEAKSVPEAIFGAIDRCSYNALLLTSSSGLMTGRFYESQNIPSLGYQRVKVGLLDCPHITKDKVDRLEAQYGPGGATPNAAYLASVLHGKFMVAEGEARFDVDGLDYLVSQCDAEDADPSATVGQIVGQDDTGIRRDLIFSPDTRGWCWQREKPMGGLEYIGFCDPMTGEQSEGAKERDMHSAGIIRRKYIEQIGGRTIEHDDEVVAVLHAPGGCRWHNDVLAERLSLLLRLYGDPCCIVEANNSGMEVMRLLLLAGRVLWKRERPNHRIPGKKMIEVVGFNTTAASKNLWIGALSTAISQRTLVCRYRLAVEQFQTFVLDEAGRGCAQAGCHDDWITGVGLGLFALPSATRMPKPAPLVIGSGAGGYHLAGTEPLVGAWS